LLQNKFIQCNILNSQFFKKYNFQFENVKQKIPGQNPVFKTLACDIENCSTIHLHQSVYSQENPANGNDCLEGRDERDNIKDVSCL